MIPSFPVYKVQVILYRGAFLRKSNPNKILMSVCIDKHQVRRKDKVTNGKAFAVPSGLLLILLFALTTSVTFAKDKDENPFRPGDSRQISTTVRGEVVETVIALNFTNADPNIVQPAAGLTTTVNGQTVEYANCAGAATNGSFVYHCYARTRRIAGSGNYRTEAHAALIPDAQYGTPVFSNATHTCAEVSKTNAESKTCQSPNQSSWHGRKWGIVSGHMFDTDLSNPYASTCPGCIDWLFTTP